MIVKPQKIWGNYSINPSSAICADQESLGISMGRVFVLERVARTLLRRILLFDWLAVFVNQNAHWLAHDFSPD